MVKIQEYYHNYSGTAMKEVMRSSIGKPARDADGNVIGTIVKATRISNNVIEFDIEVM